MRAFLLTVCGVCVCCLVFWFALTRGLGSGRREREAGEKRERERSGSTKRLRACLERFTVCVEIQAVW